MAMKVWGVPVASVYLPAVRVVSDALPSLYIIVYSSGLDAQIAYNVRFSSLVAFRVHQEGMMPSSFPNVGPYRTCCSFKDGESNWKREFVEASPFIEVSFGRRFSDLMHYLIIGGDQVVEVLAYDPEVKRVEKAELP